MRLTILSHTAGLIVHVTLSSCCCTEKKENKAAAWAHLFQKSIQLGLKQHSRLIIAARIASRVFLSGWSCLILHCSFFFCNCYSIRCVLCCWQHPFAQKLNCDGLTAQRADGSLLCYSQNALPASETPRISPQRSASTLFDAERAHNW